MQFKGQLVAKISEREGDSQNGHWRIAQFLLQEVSSWPRKLVVDVSDDHNRRIESFDARIGQNVTVNWDIDAREYNGRWFNSVRAYAISDFEEPTRTAPAPAPAQAAPAQTTSAEPVFGEPQKKLPF